MTRYIRKAALLGSLLGLVAACTSAGSASLVANGNPRANSAGMSGSVNGGDSSSSGSSTAATASPEGGGSSSSLGFSDGGSDSNSDSGGGPHTGGLSTAAGGALTRGGDTSASGASATSFGGNATGGKSIGGTAAGGGAIAGGTSGTGSISGSGGGSDAGGRPGTGGAPSTGGATSDVCVWQDGPSANNGGLTCYWFSQGTSKDEKTCPGGYKTYCGYCGSETGEKPQGDGQIWCPINDIASSVENISTPHFVAIPPGPLAQGKNCGMCVEVKYMGRSIIATVIDACPSCLTDQHIDLSLSAAKALGMTEQVGQVESGVTWRVVGCPTTSEITVSFNGGYQGQVYFQNAAFPIAKAVSGDREAKVNTGFWDFSKEMGGQEVTLTDVMGHTVTAIVPSTPGSLGVQFDLTCQ